jgi:hypothetical protein
MIPHQFYYQLMVLGLPWLFVVLHLHPRTVDTSRHFCPHAGCRYRGGLGLGNLRANDHPSGGPWRQLHCTACDGSFPEHHGTIFHGKRVAVELIIHVLACLAEGLGIRGTARVFEVAPNTVLEWFVEAADQLVYPGTRAFRPPGSGQRPALPRVLLPWVVQ